MKNGFVVIGSGFGDEGKGVMTDYFVEKEKADLVVRFNSGAQAGHSVVRANKRHVFGHFGSGTFQGVPTALSKYFVVNPLKFRQERVALQNFGIFIPDLFVDPECIITTPYDILMNQLNEKYRGQARHGSCGMGFNETIIRHLGAYDNRFNDERSFNEMSDPRSRTTYEYVAKHYKEKSFVERLKRIRKTWFWDRFNELAREGVFANGQLEPEELELLNSDGLIENYIKDLEFMLDYTKSGLDVRHNLLKQHETIVFEGAQGLQLAQDSGNFPHVTRSYTGRRNVAELLKKEKYDSLETTYVTRCYQTKHGAGPFEDQDISEFIHMVDPTNKPNEFQGTIRTAFLNTRKLFRAIDRDVRENPIPKSDVGLAITCLDQIVGEKFRYSTGTRIETLNKKDFLIKFVDVAHMLGVDTFYASLGPVAATMKRVSAKDGVVSATPTQFSSSKTVRESERTSLETV